MLWLLTTKLMTLNYWRNSGVDVTFPEADLWYDIDLKLKVLITNGRHLPSLICTLVIFSYELC